MKSLSFLDSGYEMIEGYLSSEQLTIFDKALGELHLPKSVGGMRNAEKKFECIQSFVSSERALGQVALFLEGTPKFVRAILFNKNSSQQLAFQAVPCHASAGSVLVMRPIEIK